MLLNLTDTIGYEGGEMGAKRLTSRKRRFLVREEVQGSDWLLGEGFGLDGKTNGKEKRLQLQSRDVDVTSRGDVHLTCDKGNAESAFGSLKPDENNSTTCQLLGIRKDAHFNVMDPMKSEGPWYLQVGQE